MAWDLPLKFFAEKCGVFGFLILKEVRVSVLLKGDLIKVRFGDG